MVRVTWVEIAKKIAEMYMEGKKCKICGQIVEVEEGNVFKRYAEIYRHFKENHPDIVEQIKTNIKSAKTPTKAIARIDAFLAEGEEVTA